MKPISSLLRLLILSVMLSGIILVRPQPNLAYADGQEKAYLPMINNRYVQGFGVIEGLVFDAGSYDYEVTEDIPIKDATVCIYETCVKTSDDGRYRIEGVRSGAHTLTASAADYYPVRQEAFVHDAQITVADITMAHDLASQDASLRIVVIWDPTREWAPGIGNDLDAHLWVSSTTAKTSHIYPPVLVGDCSGMYPNACHVNDDFNGYGPETVDIRRFESNATYYFGVLNQNQGRTNVPPIIKTAAKVLVYGQEGLAGEFTIPTQGTGDFWYVFAIDANQELIPARGDKGCIIWYPGNAIPKCP